MIRARSVMARTSTVRRRTQYRSMNANASARYFDGDGNGVDTTGPVTVVAGARVGNGDGPEVAGAEITGTGADVVDDVVDDVVARRFVTVRRVVGVFRAGRLTVRTTETAASARGFSVTSGTSTTAIAMRVTKATTRRGN